MVWFGYPDVVGTYRSRFVWIAFLMGRKPGWGKKLLIKILRVFTAANVADYFTLIMMFLVYAPTVLIFVKTPSGLDYSENVLPKREMERYVLCVEHFTVAADLTKNIAQTPANRRLTGPGKCYGFSLIRNILHLDPTWTIAVAI